MGKWNPQFLVLWIAAVFITAFIAAYYSGKVENNLKAVMTRTRELLLQPEKLTPLGVKYRRLCFTWFSIFVGLLIGVPVVAA